MLLHKYLKNMMHVLLFLRFPRFKAAVERFYIREILESIDHRSRNEYKKCLSLFIKLQIQQSK